MERNTSGSSTILQRISCWRARRSNEFYNQVLNSLCAKWSIPYPSSRFPAEPCDLEPIYERLLMGFIFAYKGSRRLDKDGDELKSSKGTRFDTVCTTKWKYWSIAKTHTICKSCRTGTHFPWSRITVLSDPAAKLDQDDSSHVLRICIVCWSLESRSILHNWATKVEDVWNERGFVGNLILGAREVQLIWHIFPCASTLDINKHIQKYLTGQTPESLDESIIFMSMFNDMEWTEKGNTETCLHNAKEVAAFATHFKPGQWCFLGTFDRKKGSNGNSNALQATFDIVELLMVDIFMCHSSHSIFPTTEPLSLGQLRKGGSNHHFQGTCENNKILIKTKMTSNFRCINNRIRQWYETQNQVPAPRTAEDEEKINLEPEQLASVAERKTADNATSSRRLDAASHRESRDADSESCRTGIICQNGGKWTILHHHWICYGWKHLYSFVQRFLRTKEFSKFEISISSERSCQDRTSDWKRRILICTQFGSWCSSTVTRTRKIDVLGTNITWQHARQFIPSETDHTNLEAASSKQKISCGRPWAQETGEHLPVRFLSCARAEASINWFQSASLEIDPSKSVNHNGLWIRRNLQAVHEDPKTDRLSWIRRSSTMGSCFDKHAKCWANSELGQRQDRKWRTVRIKAVRLFTFVQYKDTVMVPESFQLFYLKEIPLTWKEHVFHTGRSSNNKSILENGLWAGGSSLRSTRQACFLSPLLNPKEFVIETADDRLDRTSSLTKNGIVTAKLSPRAWLHFFQSTTSWRRKFRNSFK